MRADYRYLRMALALVILLSALVHSSALAGPILLDPTFDGDGIVTTLFGTAGDFGNAVALQPDGKIVAAGTYLSDNRDFALVRYNSDGSRDTTFGSSGRRAADFFGADDIGRAVAIQPDGKIIVAGTAWTGVGNDSDFALVRYNSNGSQDPTFGTNGEVTTDFGFPTQGNDMALGPDGKIVVAGFSDGFYNYDLAVARYNSDGSPDTTFSDDGKLLADGPTHDASKAVVVQPDGKIIVAGYTGGDFYLVRYNGDGSPDPTFGDNGEVTTEFDLSNFVNDLVLQPDGKILAAGQNYADGDDDIALARYNSDGSPDTTFSTDGKVTTDFGGAEDAQAVVVLPDGRIVVAGSNGSQFAVARYHSNGSLDVIFDGDGKVTTSIGISDQAFAAALQPDGRLIVAGQSNNGSDYDFALVRYLADAAVFADVPLNYWAWSWIERLYIAGVTGGCAVGPLQYCPEASVTRAQMAVFLERGINESSYTPPPSTGMLFADVPLSYWAADWINKLSMDGITTGCGGGNYCPEAPVTRAQMAVFLLRSKYGAGYTPPAVGAGTGFGDVPPGYWAAAFIKQLVTEGITAGCGGGNYCPEQPVTRAQMAVFLVRTFSLP